MRLATLVPFLVAAHQALAAPVADSGSNKKSYHAIKTVVKVARHRGALEDFIASEEVSASITRTSRPPKTDKSIDNTPVDISDIDSPAEVLDVARPLPTEVLVSLSRPRENAGVEDKTETNANWAVALLKDVYADYRSVSPCWRQHNAETSGKLRHLMRGKRELFIFLGIGVLLTGILILETIYQNVMSLRRRMGNAGGIRLEGPERSLEAQDFDKKQVVIDRENLNEKDAAL